MTRPDSLSPPIAKLLTPAQAAEVLGISLRTLQHHVDDGSLPRIIIGRGHKRKHYAFDPADIERFKTARKEFGAPKCPSLKGTGKRNIPTISLSPVIDLRAIQAQRAAARRKQ